MVVQVVAGKKYVLTILVGRSTDCRKAQDRETTDSCHIGGISVSGYPATQ